MNKIEREVVRTAKVIAKLQDFLKTAESKLASVRSVKTEKALRKQAVRMDNLDLRVQKLANNVACGFGDIGYELDEAANDIMDAREEAASAKAGPGFGFNPAVARKLASRMAARKAKPRLAGARGR